MFRGLHRQGRAAAYLLAAATILATLQTARADDVVGAWTGTWQQDGYAIVYGQGHLTITSVEAGAVTGEGSAFGVRCSSPYGYAGKLGSGEVQLLGTTGGGCPEVKLTLEHDGETKLTGRYKVSGGKGGEVHLKRAE